MTEKPAYRPLSGFFLALSATMFWGTIPLSLKGALLSMDSQTIVWFRFAVAAVGLAIILKLSGNLPNIRLMIQGRFRWLVILGVFGLSANFILYNTALEYIIPSVSQIIAQVSPFALMVVGVVVFKEKLGIHQKLGALMLAIGLLLFFNERLAELLTSMSSYTKGVIMGVSASAIWTCYALAQKLMLRRFNSQQILFVFYIGCALVFTPNVHIQQVTYLTWFSGLCLAYSCLNTLVAYGAYAEALNRWDVSKVSAVVTLTPLFTILFSEIANKIDPERFAGAEMNTLAYLGALIVVCGALFSAIGHKFLPKKQQRKGI